MTCTSNAAASPAPHTWKSGDGTVYRDMDPGTLDRANIQCAIIDDVLTEESEMSFSTAWPVDPETLEPKHEHPGFIEIGSWWDNIPPADPRGDAITHFASHWRRVGQRYLDMATQLEAIDPATIDWTPMLFQVVDGDEVLSEHRNRDDVNLRDWQESHGHPEARIVAIRRPRASDEHRAHAGLPVEGGAK